MSPGTMRIRKKMMSVMMKTVGMTSSNRLIRYARIS